MKTFDERLNYAMKQANMKAIELANKCNLDRSTISNYLSGRYAPKYDKAFLLANALGVSTNWLMGYSNDINSREFKIKTTINNKTAYDVIGNGKHIGVNKNNIVSEHSIDYEYGNELINVNNPNIVKIPVLGLVQAGLPITAVENIIDYEEIDKSKLGFGEYFALKIKGSSMSPLINEHDIVVVRKQSSVDSNDIAIVLINGQDANCKKVIKHDNGITLFSLNPLFEPMYYSDNEVETLPIEILGKVVELRRTIGS